MFEDVWNGIWKNFHEKDDNTKFYEETLPKAMKELEPYLAGDGWLVGNKLSIADFYIGGFWTNIITHAPYT